jgi:hypothetical protein
MENIEEGVKTLKNLELGLYLCKRLKYINRKELELTSFRKELDEELEVYICIGDNESNLPENFLKDFTGKFSPIFNISKIEDNPVPSLDNLEKEFNNRADLWGYDSGETVKNLFKFLKEKLENGVETNKEQPKCNTCKKVIGTWRSDNIQGSSKGYYSCDDCFHRVWARAY